jgi:hypothetical protein
MSYVAGEYRPPDSAAWFADALRRYGLTAVAFVHSAPWRREMEDVLERHGWQPLSSGAYDIWVKSGRGATTTNRAVGESSRASNLRDQR